MRISVGLFAVTLIGAWAADVNTRVFSSMHWRLIGPHRAGRVTSVAGSASEPNTYYIGTPGGGVWKTTNAGQVWQPIFDQDRVSSIGAITVAPSDPKILYVGTGEQTQGKGVYKSTDGGATWASAGLRDTRFIQSVIVDPVNPNIVIAGANSIGFGILWRPLPQSATTIERGIFKSTDGGKTWTKTLTRDDTLGIIDLCADPNNPRLLYGVLFLAAGSSEIVRSTDEGTSWAPLPSKGLPEKDRGRVGIAVATGLEGRRLYAVMKQGFFRSDDAGATWTRSTKDPRIEGSLYFSRIFADTQNPDLLYVAQTSLYRSVDGGKTFEAYVGAPSGDDFHVLWIDPRNPARMVLGVDQGAIVSVDAGHTWSSWYNQPTGQFYHVSTDNAFPYRVYGAQQDSGTAAVQSRSDYGEITEREWMPIGGFEYSFIVADPLHPNLVYSGGWYGTVVRFDRTTGQTATVFERGDKYRVAQMAPLCFSPQDPRTLYLGTQFVLKTGDGGVTWQTISPDLTGYVEKAGKQDPDKAKPPAITALSPSPAQAGVIWAGTKNRVVQVTRDGGTIWQNVSPPGLAEPTEILTLDASFHDAATAYVAVGATRESTPPTILRTHDFGRTWQKVVNGLPEVGMVRVVREDPKRRHLLFAGTDIGVFASFDDGDHWQPLQLGLPTTPVTDLTIHDVDLVASTFGRALWILDDITPLRQMSAQIAGSPAYLFQPAEATRVRWDNNPDTPLPIETPAGLNPPDGAIVNYFLQSPANGEIGLTIYDARGGKVREFSGRAESPNLPLPNVPEYWFAPPMALPTAAGVNRFVWDLRYPPPLTLPYSYGGDLLEYTEYTLPDHAVPGNTPRQQPQGSLVPPGAYAVELKVVGQTLRQNLNVKLDPRVHASDGDMQALADLEHEITRGMAASYNSFNQVAALRTALADRKKSEKLKPEVEALEKKIDAIDKGTNTAPGLGPVNRDLTRLASSVGAADGRPAETVRAAVEEKCKSLGEDLTRWRSFNEADLTAFNGLLKKNNLSPLPVVTVDAQGCRP